LKRKGNVKNQVWSKFHGKKISKKRIKERDVGRRSWKFNRPGGKERRLPLTNWRGGNNCFTTIQTLSCKYRRKYIRGEGYKVDW